MRFASAELLIESLLVSETRGAEPRGSAPSTRRSGPLTHSSPLKSATASSRPARRMRTSGRAMNGR